VGLRDEIHEQPEILQRLIEERWEHIQEVAADIRRRRIDYAFLAARGTSDHAGLYAKYLWGAYNQLPVALATPSLFSLYRLPPRLGPALAEAWRLGCRFDGWSECFRFDLWQEAFARTGVDPAWYACRRYAYSDLLPWEHIDAGVSKRYLLREHQRALAGKPTVDCREGKCSGCGLCIALEIEPELAGGKKIAPVQGSV